MTERDLGGPSFIKYKEVSLVMKRKTNPTNRKKRRRKYQELIPYLLLLLLTISPLVYTKYTIAQEQNQKVTTYEKETKGKSVADVLKNLVVDKKETTSSSEALDFDVTPKQKQGSYKITDNSMPDVLAVLSVPKINMKIPVYQGTSKKVLDKGVGVLENTDLPVGGEGTHSVLTAHSGLSIGKLFDDVRSLKLKDKFYLKIGKEIHAYEVDQIKKVLPEDIAGPVAKVEGQDYVTLLTCTPMYVNSHRLLVRGHRVPYKNESLEGKFYISILGRVFISLFLIVLILTIRETYKIYKSRKEQEAPKNAKTGSNVNNSPYANVNIADYRSSSPIKRGHALASKYKR